uniref:E3 ubiquitin-protein ligase n=1 Tax=Branchiostoma floridae TaxID=7739 RepID=C3Y5X0_BRAFL|eukprot:XP_002608357.1 hypothetical protein BRAFLDRAFT_91316 [Branchiostoma floridae]
MASEESSRCSQVMGKFSAAPNFFALVFTVRSLSLRVQARLVNDFPDCVTLTHALFKTCLNGWDTEALSLPRVDLAKAGFTQKPDHERRTRTVSWPARRAYTRGYYLLNALVTVSFFIVQIVRSRMRRGACDNMGDVTGEGEGIMDDKSSRNRARRDDDPDNDRRSILVSNIPDGINKDKLEIHFMRKSNGGGDIENITLRDSSTAKITYMDESSIQGVLDKEQFIRDKKVEVQRWPLKPDGAEGLPRVPQKDSYEGIQVFKTVRALVGPEKSRYITESWKRTVKMGKDLDGIKFKKGKESNGVEIVGKWGMIRKVRSLLQIEVHCAQGTHANGQTTSQPGTRMPLTHVDKGRTSGQLPHTDDDQDGGPSASTSHYSKQVNHASQTIPDDPIKIVIDPDIMSYLKQVNGLEVLDIILKNKAVIVMNDVNGQTEVEFFGSNAAGSDPNNALEEFTTLYQKTHHGIVCKTLELRSKHIPPDDISKAVAKITEDFPRVMLKTSADKGVMFYGTEREVQEAKTAMCEHLGIAARGRRRRGTDGAAGLPGASRRGETGSSSTTYTEWFNQTTSHGIQIVVARGDITQQPVDVIANAANEYLSHGSGVAGAISRAGGPSVQQESSYHVKTFGRVRVTETVVTRGGQLPCKHIIHAVGPRWERGHENENERQLRQTCYNILTAASATLRARSVAIPAISSGIFGMPKQKCAESLVSGLERFLQTAKVSSCTLRRIIFIDMDQATVNILADTFGKKLTSITTDPEASPDGGVSRPPPDRDCIDTALSYKSQCPMCKAIVGELRGNQPPGRMDWHTDHRTRLPGFESCGAIIIYYNFPSGKQGSGHPNPGRYFSGTSRTAYLPDNEEGRELVQLLKRAFDNRLVFTIGTSVTTGATDTVVWNDIHHKTNTHGGASGYGYPDPGYLTRLREELAAKGIKTIALMSPRLENNLSWMKRNSVERGSSVTRWHSLGFSVLGSIG